MISSLKKFAVDNLQFVVKRVPFNYKKYGPEKFRKYGLTSKYVDIKNDEAKWDENFKVLKGLFEKYNITKNSSFLDIGCGSGMYSKRFKESGFTNYTGADFIEEMIEALNQNYGGDGFKFIRKNIVEENLNGMGTYDLIMMIDVTQHIIKDKDFKKIMNNVQNILNKGGLFFVTDNLDKDKRESVRIRRRPLTMYRDVLDLEYIGREEYDKMLNNGKQLFIFQKKMQDKN